MKAALVYGVNDLRIEEVADPEPSLDEIIVKVRACGICSTDIKTLSSQGSLKKLPTILGHEVAGEIYKVGKNVTNLLIGERVAVYPIAVCGECFFCRSGRHNLCEQEFGLAHGIEGGFAEFVRIPKQIIKIGGIHSIPEDITFEEAALAEPLSCCIAASRLCKITKGDTVMVTGAGPMGLFHLKVLKYLGATVIMTDILEQRLNTAQKMGADICINPEKTDLQNEVKKLTAGRGVDVIIAALNQPAIMEQYLHLVRKGGIFNIFGGPLAGSILKVDPRWLHYNEINLTGTFASTPSDYEKAIHLICSKNIDVKDMITHRFSLDDMLNAVALAKNHKMIKGVVSIYN